MTSTTLREMLVKQEPRPVSYCYVCSGPRADYMLFSKPFGDHPFFPFLEHHPAPESAETMKPDGRVFACLVCYTLLTQQWDSYEKSKTPQNKRIYWLKRLDGGPFAGMDLNLQQDYESLFEASNAAIETTDVRPKQKHARGHHTPSMDVKPKLSDHIEQGFPSGFGFVNHGAENVATNILDLSMSTRTPSRSSSSASPSIGIEVCYLCGQESKSVNNVFAKPIANCPHFPSIAMHPKPPNAKPMDANGRVLACEQCHKVLLQQWDSYQRQNVPHSERVYQLRAPNVVVKSESKDKTFTCYTCGMISQVSVQRSISAFPEKEGDPYFSFLLNHVPHPGANKLIDGKAAVCSLCYKTLFRQLRVYEVSDTPEERRKYKILNDSGVENFSVLRQHLKGGGQSQEPDSKTVCYVCESLNDVVFSVNSLAAGDMFFPFLRNLPKPTGASPIDNQGRVKVCSQCHKSLMYQWDAFEHALIPINQRQYKISNSKASEKFFVESSGQQFPLEASHVREEVQDAKRITNESCSLCEQPLSSDNACFIETMPHEKNMYFPSIRLLIKPSATSAMDPFGRVLACNQCHSILKNQWEVFESAQVPHTQRQYEIFSSQREHVLRFNNDPHLAEASSALHIQVSSPDLKVDLTKHSAEPLLTTVNTLPSSTMTMTNAQLSGPPSSVRMPELKALPVNVKPQSNTDEPMPRICGPLDVPFVRPILLGPINCFVCSEHNASGLIYAIKSLPTVPVGVEKPPEDVPFFPFLSKHPAPDGAEKIANDGSALVCVFCYHSLISQWLAYESSPYPEDANRWHRRYNTHNYVCYICGITTYRKRVCTISVRDFPFLLEHSRPPGALTVLNGECVVTCQTCYESITSQWKDFERMKVPVEMRKYNWIVMPPPPDDENSRGCQILSSQDGAIATLPSDSDAHFDESSIPHGLKPPPPHLGMPPAPYGISKPVVRNVMSPVHQGNSLPNAGFSPYGNNVNSALNATRTSSFAAALRKLAKQAVDPTAEKELSPISPAASPSSSQPSSTHSRHHGPPVSMYMNSHNSAPPHHGSSPPMGSVPPLQSSQGKALDLGRYSAGCRNANGPESSVVKMENSKYISSSTDKRMESGSGNKYLPSGIPINAHHDHASSRGFQPYRNSEERHSTPPQMYNPSPPPTTMSGYAYHPSYPQSSQMPPQPYRLEESVYMERYGLLRPSVMPYPPSSNLLSHPRAPLYPASHYPPELLRSLPPSNSTTYPSSRYAQEDENPDENREMMRKREIEMYRERERYEEERENASRELEYLRKERSHMRQSPISIPHSTTRTEMQMEEKGHMGSITHGTPRDYIRRPSPPTSSVPLNLATNVNSVEREMKAKEEYNSRHQRHHNNSIVNGQVHHRSKNHQVYRKESDGPPYKIQYHLNSESHQKQPSNAESSENKTSVPSKIFPYYVEQEYQKPDVVETRTLSMASVINSQINGIFAREKFPSNNSYDYFNFPPSSERGGPPETQSKSKTESKSSLPSQENYVIQTKPSSGDKYESADSSSNKIHFVKSEHAISHSESSKFAPVYKPREASLTRALLQNHVLPAYRSENNFVEEVGPKVVSTLDLREVRMRKRRQAPDFVESEESEPDSDEEDALRYKSLLTITKGPPVKIEMNPKKTKFLTYFGLTTHRRKQIIEIKKCIRRHQILREKSCSPVLEKPKEPLPEYDEKHLAELAKRLCFEEDFQAKTEFLKMFGLMFVPPEQREEKEKIQKVVEEEKLRRYGYLPPSDLCIELQGHHLKKRGYNNLNISKLTNAKKANLGPCDSSQTCESTRQNSSSEKLSKLQTSSAPKLSAFLKPPTRTSSVNLPVPPLIPSNQVITSSEPLKDSSKNIVTSKDPRVRQINKDFVQEFHKSVLQTTQMQLAEKKNLPSNVHMEPSMKLSPVSSPEKCDWSPEEHKPNFHWPGIEAIMESYECHISEQTAEKKFLVDSCQKLKALIQESDVKIECLGRKTEEMLKEKQKLDFESQELQKSLETIKSFIQRFR